MEALDVPGKADAAVGDVSASSIEIEASVGPSLEEDLVMECILFRFKYS